jgi:beta-N-acetylhexosaminidase
MLLIPPDLDAGYRAMLKAVQSGEIPQSRLDDSVLKILKMKASLGLHRARLIDPATLDSTVGRPDNVAAGQQMADDAVTLVRENGPVLPLKKTGTAKAGLPYQGMTETHNRLVVVVFSDDVRLDAGRVLERQIKARVPDANVIYTDPTLAGLSHDRMLSAARSAEQIVVAIYASPTAGKMINAHGKVQNSVGLAGDSATLFKDIIDSAASRTIVVALGNPYLAKDFPEVQNYICTFSAAPVSELSAVKALFGEIEFRGHSPVEIPGIASRGAGTVRTATK